MHARFALQVRALQHHEAAQGQSLLASRFDRAPGPQAAAATVSFHHRGRKEAHPSPERTVCSTSKGEACGKVATSHLAQVHLLIFAGRIGSRGQTAAAANLCRGRASHGEARGTGGQSTAAGREGEERSSFPLTGRGKEVGG